MSSQNNYLRGVGSVQRNLKRALVIAALLFSGEASAEESKYNMRIHRNFMKRVADKNFHQILAHIEGKVDKDVFLTEINANVDQLDMRIKPRQGQEWDDIHSDLFFDQGQLVLEVGDLEFSGTGLITDPETKVQAKIELHAPLDLCQIIMSLEQQVSSEGSLLPKIDVTDAALTLHKDQFRVETQGQLPIYRSNQFKSGLQKWMLSQMKSREADFKERL